MFFFLLLLSYVLCFGLISDTSHYINPLSFVLFAGKKDREKEIERERGREGERGRGWTEKKKERERRRDKESKCKGDR